MIQGSDAEMTVVTRLKVILALLLVCQLLVVACSPPASPAASAQLRLMTASSATPMLAQLDKLYNERYRRIQIQTSESSAEVALKALAARQVDLVVIEGGMDVAQSLNPDSRRPQFKIWPLATDGIAIIVHPTNPVQKLSKDELGRIFEGVEQRWEAFGGGDARVQLVSRQGGAPSRQIFEQTILQGKPLAGSAVLMPSDGAVADYVAGHRGAIGYLSMAWLLGNNNIKAVSLDGVLPTPSNVASGRYPLSHPLLLVTRTAMSDETKAFVDFILGPIGRQIIAKSYAPPR